MFQNYWKYHDIYQPLNFNDSLFVSLWTDECSTMASVFSYKREAIRIKATKYEVNSCPECKRFSVDPQLTSYEVLRSFLAKAFDIKVNFSICYKCTDDYGHETYLPLLSDWDLDAAFLGASDPYLTLRVDLKPFEETCDVDEETPLAETKQGSSSIHGFFMNHVEKTLSIVQRALNLSDGTAQEVSAVPPRPPLSDADFRALMHPSGQLGDPASLRNSIYLGGVEPALRKVVWKHLLNVYPDGLSGKERMEYIKKKSQEYISLRDTWRELLKNGQLVGDLGYVTSMVRKDVLRTDRHHPAFAGGDDNKNIASLFNILTTYAVNHPAVSYCQGMSDLASPLLVVMGEEAHAYVCFCALMRRLSPSFLLDGITMTQRFHHLATGLAFYDPEFFQYLKSHQADDLLFCYRWLLLEMKREFAFDDALRMLEVMWSSLPPSHPPEGDLPLFQVKFVASPQVPSPRPKENAYTKVCQLRRSGGVVSLDERGRGSLVKTKPFASMDDTVLASEPRRVRNLNEFTLLGGMRRPTSQDSSPSDDDPCDYAPMTTSFTRELRLELESLERHVIGNDERVLQEVGDGVYVWENPLERSPEEQPAAESELLRRRKGALQQLPAVPNGSATAVPKGPPPPPPPAEAANQPPPIITPAPAYPPIDLTSVILPPPSEFGSGNPFLMFLCITVLRQHRDHVIAHGMDYNEMAMHFDKMVRKHNVNRVLNQARDMFESYLAMNTSPAQKV